MTPTKLMRRRIEIIDLNNFSSASSLRCPDLTSGCASLPPPRHYQHPQDTPARPRGLVLNTTWMRRPMSRQTHAQSLKKKMIGALAAGALSRPARRQAGAITEMDGSTSGRRARGREEGSGAAVRRRGFKNAALSTRNNKSNSEMLFCSQKFFPEKNYCSIYNPINPQ